MDYMHHQSQIPTNTTGVDYLMQHMFYSDENGTVILHMGSLDYNANAEKVDSFYRIYINGLPTQYTVTSTGSNKTRLVQIDLAKIR